MAVQFCGQAYMRPQTTHWYDDRLTMWQRRPNGSQWCAVEVESNGVSTHSGTGKQGVDQVERIPFCAGALRVGGAAGVNADDHGRNSAE
jgi:hypothetical protein